MSISIYVCVCAHETHLWSMSQRGSAGRCVMQWEMRPEVEERETLGETGGRRKERRSRILGMIQLHETLERWKIRKKRRKKGDSSTGTSEFSRRFGVRVWKSWEEDDVSRKLNQREILSLTSSLTYLLSVNRRDLPFHIDMLSSFFAVCGIIAFPASPRVTSIAFSCINFSLHNVRGRSKEAKAEDTRKKAVKLCTLR